MCSYRFGVSMGEGEFRDLLCHHLGPGPTILYLRILIVLLKFLSIIDTQYIKQSDSSLLALLHYFQLISTLL